MPLDQNTFANRLCAIEARIASALLRRNRERSAVKLVAVTKKFSAEHIRHAYAAGLREFGENYVQEFAEKRPHLSDLAEARFHLIGHLQSNKARLACDLFQVVQTIDSAKLMQRLDKAAGERGSGLEALIELKLSSEESKSGALPEHLPEILEAALSCHHLTVTGLMTMPPWSENAELSRPYFQELARLARQYGLKDLSMGMTNDFEVAIEEGATIIRLGTALFGARPKPQRGESNQL